MALGTYNFSIEMKTKLLDVDKKVASYQKS